jgi:hypothetical protein
MQDSGIFKCFEHVQEKNRGGRCRIFKIVPRKSGGEIHVLSDLNAFFQFLILPDMPCSK